MRRQALGLAARLVERRLNADCRDRAGTTLPCGCGGRAAYAGRRTKTVTDTAERWAKRRRDELDDGRIGALLAALRRHEGRDEARRCIEYVRRNRHRMQYPKSAPWV